MILSETRVRGSVIELILEDGEIITLPLREEFLNFSRGDNLSDETIDKLYFVMNIFIVKNAAFRLIARRDHSEAELKRKLAVKFTCSDAIHAALDQLKNENYLDDKRFAETYISQQISNGKNGQLKIKNKLREKGISPDIYEPLLSDISAETFEENLCLLIEKKAENKSGNNDKNKLIRFLQGKGYYLSDIMEAIKKLKYPG